RLGHWLAAQRPQDFASLQPGVTDAQLDAFLTRFSFKLPTAFPALYRRRNGQPHDCFEHPPGDREFCSPGGFAESKAMLDSMIGHDFEEGWWRRGWVPFLHNGGGSYLCVDITAEEGGTPGQLVAFWKADADRPIEYASLEEWIERLVSSMEDGTIEIV